MCAAAAACAEAAAADAEEESLLQFAEELDWQELLQDLGDEELSAAFKVRHVMPFFLFGRYSSAGNGW
jgi:hypothetical protein